MNEKKPVLEILLYLLLSEREMNLDLKNKCFYLNDETYSELMACDFCITKSNEVFDKGVVGRLLGLPIKIDNNIVFAEIR
jgi:hypothetical protein